MFVTLQFYDPAESIDQQDLVVYLNLGMVKKIVFCNWFDKWPTDL